LVINYYAVLIKYKIPHHIATFFCNKTNINLAITREYFQSDERGKAPKKQSEKNAVKNFLKKDEEKY